MALRKQQSKLETTIKNINDKTMYGLNVDKLKEYYALVNNEDIFCDFLIRLANNPHVDSYTYMQRLEFAIKRIYSIVVNSEEDLENFYGIINIYLENPGLITKESLENLNNAFSDKKLIYETYLFLNQENRFGNIEDVEVNNINLITEYLVKAREHYVDDRALFASFINLIQFKMGIDILKYGNEEEIIKYVHDKVVEDCKANGVYEISEEVIREFDRKIESMGLLRERLDTLLTIAKSEREKLSSEVNEASEQIKNARIAEVRALNEEARKVISEFDSSYLALINKQKSTIFDERDRLIAEIEDYFNKKKDDLLSIVDKVSLEVGIEVSRIKKASNDSIGTLKDYVATNEGINKIIESAANNQALVKRMALVEELAAKMDQGPIIVPVASSATPSDTAPSNEVQSVASSPQIVVPNKTIIVPTQEIEEAVDYTINYYFDKSKKYKERFKKLQEKKGQMEDQGELFHEKFDDVLIMIIENDCPYMYGPSGCGKTYLIEEQMAKLLEVPVITNGYIQYEQDVVGYTNAGNGDYVKTNFYRAFRTGKMIFFDELDNSNSNATTILNSFLNRRANATYSFPSGINTIKHPNFRIITAGNTRGTGKTVAHNTRQKMDESVMQRVTPIAIGYDNRIEQRILKDYPGWFEFAVCFRKAVEEYPLNGDLSEPNSVGTFTTRDAETIRDYKDDGAFSDEKLIDFQIIENKDMDYLTGIKNKMNSSTIKTEEGKKLLKIFNNRVEEMVRYASRR